MSEEQSLFKKLFRPQSFFLLLIIVAMFIWHKFIIKPNETEKVNSYYSHNGHYAYKESAGVFDILTEPLKHTVKGQTMGTISYTIHYYDEKDRNFKPQVDSLLVQFNQTFSTYIPDSKISEFNSGKSISVNKWMIDLHKRASKIHNETDGVFDPTIKPLLSYWGFGSSPISNKKDTLVIDSLKSLVNYKNIFIENKTLTKSNPNLQLDYGAIAKGYGVDVVADFLKSKNVTSFMVEIGGEISTGDSKPNGKKWALAVEKPLKNERKGIIYFNAENISEATSGNYRNFKIDSTTGEKYQHTINPKTGYPVKNKLLSVTVLHKNCLEADAYATALMVMGTKGAIDFSKRNDLEVCLIYNEGNSEMQYYYSEGFKKLIVKNE